MTAERDSMTLNEVSVPALGVEERSDEAPRAGRARPTPDPEVVAKPKRRSKRRAVASPGAGFGVDGGRPGSTAGSGKLGIASGGLIPGCVRFRNSGPAPATGSPRRRT